MSPGARITTDSARVVVIAACAATAGAHAGLVPAHLDHEPRLGAAFVAATLVAMGLATLLAVRPTAAAILSAALVLAALIAAYALSVTTGIPWLAEEPEAIDGVGVATKAVEATGLVFALHLMTTPGGRGSLIRKEARS
jgi:hypothetical protein